MTSPRLKRAALGIWRLGFRRHFTRGHAMALAAMLPVLGLILVALVRSANGPGRYLGFGREFYFAFLVPLMAFIGGGGAWRDELKAEAADYFLLRGVPRAGYLVLRYLAHLACAEIDFLAALALLGAIGFAARVPNLAAALPAMLAAQVLAVAAFAALGFLLAALSSRWVIVGLVYGALVEAGVGNVPLAINRIAMGHEIRAMLGAFPATPGTPGPAAAAAWLAVLAAVLVAAAAACFSRLELAGARSE